MAQPWIVDETLVLDPMVEKYVEIAKLFRDEGYEAQAGQWQEGWFAGMNDSLVDAEGKTTRLSAVEESDSCFPEPPAGLSSPSQNP